MEETQEQIMAGWERGKEIPNRLIESHKGSFIGGQNDTNSIL